MGTPIAQVSSSRFLGVIVDQHLSWKEHIDTISTKIAKNLGILTRLSKVLPPKARSTLYYSLIYPYLTYCAIIWASAYKSNLNKLVIIHKRALRFVANIPHGAHTEGEFIRRKMLKIEQIKRLQIGIFMYRVAHNQLPTVFQNYFLNNSAALIHSSRNPSVLYVPHARTNTRLASIKCQGPRIWNSIPAPLRLLPSIQSFKNRLRSLITDRS